MTTEVAPVIYRFGRFELQTRERRLLESGVPVRVGPHAFDLLTVLVEHRGHLVTKNKLLERVWRGVIVEENSLHAQVAALRKILGAEAIATVSRHGYRFVLDVSSGDQLPSDPAARQRNNLPLQLTSFVGRETEVAEIGELLARNSLVTLAGSGGCGKTRLALEVAATLVQRYGDGVWFVELAALVDPGLVSHAVADALGVREPPDQELATVLADYLEKRQLLLVLDNAEHFLAACAQFADAMLRRCARLTLLVTSRQRLNVAGELTYRVPSLSVPNHGIDVSPQAIEAYEATRLFVERARLHQPHFAVTAQNVSALTSICRRLDGIALAIELAAANVRALSIEELSQRLDRRFDLLTGGSSVSLPRHRTLAAMLKWSYDLLDEAERILLQRVSLFAGGFTLEAAEQVCSEVGGYRIDVLDRLTSLIDKNLVLAETQRGLTRYGLLETVRLYARDRVRVSGEEPELRRQHLTYFRQLAQAAEPHLTGTEQRAWLERLESERDNLRAALSLPATSPTEVVEGLLLAGALRRFWVFRGYLFEGRAWLSEHLSRPADESAMEARAKALNSAGHLAREQGDYAAARAAHEESLALYKEFSDRAGVATSLSCLGLISVEQGELAAARALLEQSLATWRELGDRYNTANLLNNLGVVAADEGDFASARALHEEALSIRRELPDRWSIAASFMNLAMVARNTGDFAAARTQYEEAEGIYRALGDTRTATRAWRQIALVLCDEGDYDGARALFAKSLASFQSLGDRTGECDTLYGLAYTFSHRDPGKAAVLWGAGERWREEAKVRPPPIDQAREGRQIAAARTALDDDAAFDRAWTKGRAMTLDRAARFALNTQSAAYLD